jgi:hypothetical protein
LERYTQPLLQVALHLDQFKQAWEHTQQQIIKVQKSWVKHKNTPKFKEGD